MQRTEEELRQFYVSADAVGDIAIKASADVAAGRYAEATAKYTLLTELVYALATTINRAAINDLKTEYFPEDMLEGVPVPTEDEGPGQYI